MTGTAHQEFLEIGKRVENEVANFKARYDKKVTDLEADFHHLESKMNRQRINGGGDGGRALSSEEVEHRSALFEYVRKGVVGDALSQKSMNSSTGGDGGYLVPRVIHDAIAKVMNDYNPLRRVARVETVDTSDWNTLISTGGTGANWVAETAARPETATPNFVEIKPPQGELYALPYITQRLLDDSQFDLGDWIIQELADRFSQAEGQAFFNGDGVNKPKGLLTYATSEAVDSVRAHGTVQKIKTGVAGGWPASDPTSVLYDLMISLRQAYRPGAVWLMNSNTLGRIMKMVDGEGRYLWQPTLQKGIPLVLLGYPVVECEAMPDIADGAYAVAFGNFQHGYVIVDRLTSLLRDPYSNKPYVGFYSVKRIGGAAVDTNAFKLLEFAA